MTILELEQEEITTGTISDTVYVSQGWWKGKQVTVAHTIPYWAVDKDDTLECKHNLVVMHHYGKGGIHYCPTMFLMCSYCMGIAEEPEPYECNKWVTK